MSDLNIQGVEILTSKDVMIPVFEEADLCGFCCLIAFVVCLTTLITAIQSKQKKIAFASLVLTIITLSSGIFFISLVSKEKTSGIKEYKATISEDANFVEINDRFDVVSKEGRLYTLRDKATDESGVQKGE